MFRLFAIKNTLLNDDAEFEKRLALVGGERREKINALELRDKKDQSLAAGIILPLALKECGIGGTVKIEYGQWGKPHLVSPRGVHFNISHSGEWTVCAVADSQVGVDIQLVKPVDLRVAERFFTKEEADAIARAEDKENMFYRICTAKESYLKAIGTGLTRPLNSFTVKLAPSGGEICDPASNSLGEWKIAEYTQLGGYRLSCCAKNSTFADKAEILKL
ncbi:MAG: 4'-phosphopantetheinyl transferase superfamily protein [Clostridia bacterium]|nr:4'-phosphopantetheinyl transferase superfamily protein [Clostridia bacterium]